MYFDTKSYLKSNRDHSTEQALSYMPRSSETILLNLRARSCITVTDNMKIQITGKILLWGRYGQFCLRYRLWGRFYCMLI